MGVHAPPKTPHTDCGPACCGFVVDVVAGGHRHANSYLIPVCNPATETAWIGGNLPHGTPVVVADDPTVFDRIVAETLAPARSAVGRALRGACASDG
jgi:hypothetical protein